ncbi:MAG: domain S-box [Acidobacteria bacterium]|nr:domain S-box [Acidobacteriota bacterium]
MHKRRSAQLVTMYVLSLAATIALLVVWVVFVVRSGSRLADLGRGVGMTGGGVSWVVLTVGCVLLFFLIVGLTYQLAQALAARRYALKQEEFLSNVTHEMKSPLAAIKLHAQTLQEGEEVSPEERRRFLGIIEQQADRMAALVDSVLESSRLLARRSQLELRPVRLDEFLARYLAGAAPQAEVRGIALRAAIGGAARVLASEEALRRVLDNLIDNAVRHSRPGGEVRCLLTVAPARARLEVEDDGVGIPKRDLPWVFDRFYQGGREGDPQRRGTGLGLSIVAGLVREMRGSVRAHSQEGRPGTRMTVELPLAPEPEESTP